VEGTFDPVSLQPPFAEVRERVRADVFEGVKLSVYVAQRDRTPLDLILFHLARCDLVGWGDLVKLFGH
jgi:hypothetical protein